MSADTSAEDLLELAGRLQDVSSIESDYGVHFEPSYPGLTAGPEPAGGSYRVLFACRAASDDGTPLGVVFTCLIPGRGTEVVVGPITSPIAPEWKPLGEYL